MIHNLSTWIYLNYMVIDLVNLFSFFLFFLFFFPIIYPSKAMTLYPWNFFKLYYNLPWRKGLQCAIKHAKPYFKSVYFSSSMFLMSCVHVCNVSSTITFLSPIYLSPRLYITTYLFQPIQKLLFIVIIVLVEVQFMGVPN